MLRPLVWQLTLKQSNTNCWIRFSFVLLTSMIPKGTDGFHVPILNTVERVRKSIFIWLLHVPGDMYAGNSFVCCSNGGDVGTVSDALILSSGQEVRCQIKAKRQECQVKKVCTHLRFTHHGMLRFSKRWTHSLACREFKEGSLGRFSQMKNPHNLSVTKASMYKTFWVYR